MLKSLFTKPNSQSGDTIIEVLISVAICGFVLGGSYYVINHQLGQIENRQEHNQATKLVESQIEDLRAYTGPADLSTVGCFTITSGDSFIDAVPKSNQPQGVNKCIVKSDGTIAAANSAPAFTLSLNPIPQGASTTYSVTASWVAVGGGNGEVNAVFRPQ
jgi:type II secretory pathway pseudopilin PulG